MGTMLQAHKFTEADFRGERFRDHPRDLRGNSDLLCLTQPAAVAAIHAGYLDAGADILSTNSFTATRIAQADYGFDAETVRDLNVAAARLARDAADAAEAATPDRPRFVAGSLGPTNRTASMSSDVGDPAARSVTWEELEVAYGKSAAGFPALDSYELNRAIYRIPRAEFTTLRDELIDLLDVGDLVRKPVRNLSLGERMKVEVVGSLLHRPQVLFLDEPTIGLDVTMQKRIRSFVAEYNRRYEATVLLTSHYMADVEALCKRVVVIHHGKILFDGPLARLGDQFDAYKTLTVELEDLSADLSPYGDVLEREDGRVKLRVPKADTARVTARLLAERDIADLTVEDPPIEDVIELVFAQERPE